MVSLWHSLRFRLLSGITILAVIVGSSVFFVTSNHLVKITDEAQAAAYQEKLGTIIGILQERHNRLARTGAVETYLPDFQDSVLKNLQASLYVGESRAHVLIINDKRQMILQPADRAIDIPWKAISSWPPADDSGSIARIDWKDETHSCYYRKFAPWGWTAVYCVPWSLKYSDVRKFKIWLGGCMVIAILVAWIGMAILLESRLWPILRLTEAAAAMSRGNLEFHVPPGGKDEVGVLTQSFAGMREAIKEKMRELNREVNDRRQAEAKMIRLGDMLENTSDFVLMTEPDGKIVYINRAGRKLFSWLGGESDGLVQAIYPDWAAKVIEEEGIPTAIDKGLWVGETTILNATGEEIPVSQVIVAHKSEDGKVEYISSILRDLTEAKAKENLLKDAQLELGKRVTERTEELRLINETLKEESRRRQKTAEQLELFKAFADTAAQGMGIGKMNTDIIYVNPSMRKIIEHESDEGLIGHSFMQFYDETVQRYLRETVIPVLLTEGVWSGEVDTLTKTGRTVPTYSSMFIIRDGSGAPQYIAALFTDITERKAVEEELRQHRDNLEQLVQQRTMDLQHEVDERRKVEQALQKERDFSMGIINRTPSVIYGIDETGTIAFMNPAGEAVTGYSAAEIQGENWWETLFPGDQRKQVDRLYARMKQGEVRNHEMSLTAKDGSTKTLSWSYLNRQKESGQFIEIIGVGHDITERRKSEKALQVSEEKYRALYNQSEDAYMVVSPDEGFLSCNDATVQLFACRDEANFCEFSPADLSPEYQLDGRLSSEKAQEVMKKAFEKGSNFFEWRHKRTDGTEFDAIVLLNPLNIGEKMVLQATVRDVTEQHIVQQALAESEARYRSLITNFPGIVYRFTGNEEGTVEFISEYVEKLTGYPAEHFLGNTSTHFTDLIVADDRKRASALIHDALKAKRPFGLRYALVRSDGDIRHVYEQGCGLYDDQGRLLYIDGVVHDISEQTALEEQLRQAHKMDSIGQLAGGVAHDFNNMLGGISGAAELLRLRLDKDSNLSQLVDIISDAAKRAAELTQKLLTFSRKARTITVSFDVHDTIREATVLLERSIDKRITLTCDFDAKESIITGDPTQLQNMVLNLGVNARDAMEQGGELMIATTNLFLDEEFCAHRAEDLTPGEYIEISIRDTGTGISPDVVERMFEPFFTTKDVSRGTGLGLAAVYGTVTEHGGFIEVQTKINKGTVIKAILPIAIQAAKTDHRVSEEAIPGSGHVLLVDDEEIIRSTGSMMLEDLGYTVSTAKDGCEALEIYKEKGATIDMILLDMVMPLMDGADTFKALRKLNPDIRVVLCSGFSREQNIDELMSAGACAFVQKPYRRAALSSAVARAMQDK